MIKNDFVIFVVGCLKNIKIINIYLNNFFLSNKMLNIIKLNLK
jgi:hypothetical protein